MLAQCRRCVSRRHEHDAYLPPRVQATRRSVPIHLCADRTRWEDGMFDRRAGADHQESASVPGGLPREQRGQEPLFRVALIVLSFRGRYEGGAAAAFAAGGPEMKSPAPSYRRCDSTAAGGGPQGGAVSDVPMRRPGPWAHAHGHSPPALRAGSRPGGDRGSAVAPIVPRA